jgi:hypothetical protein
MRRDHLLPSGVVDQPADPLVEAIAEVDHRANDEHLEMPRGPGMNLFLFLRGLTRALENAAAGRAAVATCPGVVS